MYVAGLPTSAGFGSRCGVMRTFVDGVDLGRVQKIRALLHELALQFFGDAVVDDH